MRESGNGTPLTAQSGSYAFSWTSAYPDRLDPAMDAKQAE